MEFQFLPFDAAPELAPYLRRSFYAEGRIPYKADKILPNGLVVLLFNLGSPHRLGKDSRVDLNPSFAHSWLHGVQTTPVYNYPMNGTKVMGFLFEPVGFYALFGADMAGLVDKTVDARKHLPAEFVEIVERSLAGAKEEQAHIAVHHALVSRIGHSVVPSWLFALAKELRMTSGLLPLAETYSNIGFTRKHIATHFRKAVGVSPKVLSRIYRLEALLAAIDPKTPPNWTELALNHGFSDQAHFIHEFRRFAGLRPQQYLEMREAHYDNLQRGENVHFAPEG